MAYEIKDVVALATASVGAVLGILNSWRLFDRDRVKLKVIPRGYTVAGGPSGLCIEVVNVGFVAVTLTQVAFDLRKPRGHMFWFKTDFFKPLDLPYRLDARASVTAYVAPGTGDDPALREARRALAKTACGRVFYGSSRYFKSYVKHLRAAGQRGE